MSKRSPESDALHEGFERYLLPVLEPLGFVRVDIPKESRAVGWTIVAAECTLPSGGRLRAELESYGTSAPRFHLTGPSGGIELMCTETDPAYPKRTTVAHAMSYFEALGDARQGGEHFAARRRLALEFLAAEIAATSDQLLAAVPEVGPLVEAARGKAPWRDAALRAHTLWANRNVRSEVEDRPVEGKFTFFGAGLVVVEAESQRFTFRFDTSKIDRTRAPVVSGWWTTPAGTKQPSQLIVGDVTLRFDPSGKPIGA
jgi:hypothetical protein